MNVKNIVWFPESKQARELKEEIRAYLMDNPDDSNEDIAYLFEVSQQRVASLRNWMNRKAGKEVPTAAPRYSNADGIKKQQAREQMIEAISTSNLNTGDVLTLPFSTCELEKQLNQSYRNKFRYIGCEREPDVYYEMLRTIADERLVMNTHFGSISDKIYSAFSNEYAHLILDYCGQISTFQEEIKHAITNNIVQVGGTISVTLCKRGELKGKIAEKIEALPENFVSNDKLQIYAIKLFFSEFAGADYKISTFMEYKDDGKMPMVLVVLKRLH